MHFDSIIARNDQIKAHINSFDENNDLYDARIYSIIALINSIEVYINVVEQIARKI